jgi:hypothetical protein
MRTLLALLDVNLNSFSGSSSSEPTEFAFNSRANALLKTLKEIRSCPVKSLSECRQGHLNCGGLLMHLLSGEQWRKSTKQPSKMSL